MRFCTGTVDTAEPSTLTYDDLFRPFREACTQPDDWRVGIEIERFGVRRESAEPVQYDGERGILALFHEFVTRYGWTPHAEQPGGPVISLQRGGSSLTLEPGSQFELSGSPHPTVHQLRQELDLHMLELHSISRDLGLIWLATGFHPFARQDELSWVPKMRYGVMRVYLASRGSGALDMMRRTATVQANFDFSSEADALRKLRVALRVSPIVTAMFANSPLVEARLFGGRSYRMKVWLDVDPDRQGLLPRLWSERATLREYVEWILDVPMFLIKRKGQLVRNTGQTFRSFMQSGFGGYRPTYDDWLTHINTVFPEVRLKRTIEVRGADSVPTEYAAALPAIWTGLLYDEKALEGLERLSESWTHDQVQALRQRVAMHGLQAEFQGRPVADVAQKIFGLAQDGLARRARINDRGQDERIHLKPLEPLVARGMTPADELLAQLQDRSVDRLELARLTRA